MTNTINSKAFFQVDVNYSHQGEVLDDSTRTLFQIQKELKRMAFIINRNTGQGKISSPKYDDEVHYDDEIMSMDRGRTVWGLKIKEGWTRSR